MHEISLLQDLITKINSLADEEKAKSVTKVQIELGALAHISAEHLREHFQEAIIGSIAQQAQLDIIENPDFNHPRAQDITLLSIEIEDE